MRSLHRGRTTLRPGRPAALVARQPVAEHLGQIRKTSGFTSAEYPLTNLGQTANASAIPQLRYIGARATPDSLINFEWNAVTDAAGYWIHVYDNRADIQTGDEAVAIGMVLETVPREHLLSRAGELARQISRNGPAAVRMMKRLLMASPNLALEPFLDVCAEYQGTCQTSDEHRAALSHLLDRRRRPR